MSKVVPHIPHYKREPGNRDFTYIEVADVDRAGNYYTLRKVLYTNKKGQDCSEIIQVIHHGKTPTTTQE